MLAGATALVLAGGNGACAEAAPLSVTDFLTASEPEAVVAAFVAAFARSRSVIVPAGTRIGGLDRAIVVPEGCTLTIAGTLSGRDGRAAVLLPATGRVVGRGGLLENVSIILQSGSPSVRGIRSTGRFCIAAVQLPGPGPYRDVVIEEFDFFDGNFGILRQGEFSRLDGATIRKGRIARMWGDGVEWNVAPHDSAVLVEDLTIEGVERIDPANRFDRRNWGIGVGFAGRAYANGWPAGSPVRDFRIRRIRGKGIRQLVHVENGVDFDIADIEGEDVGARFAAGSGIEAAHVLCYGSARFAIAGIRGTGNAVGSGVKLRAGVRDGRYVVPCADFTVERVALRHGDVILEMGNVGTKAVVRDIRLQDGGFEAVGACSRMVFERIDCRRPRAAGPALALRVAPDDGRGAFAAVDGRLTLVGAKAVDEHGRPSRMVVPAGLAAHRLEWVG